MKIKMLPLFATALVLASHANAATVVAQNTASDGSNVNEWNTAGYNTTSHNVQNYSGDYGTPYNLAQTFSTGTLGTDNELWSITVGTAGGVSDSTVTAYLYAAGITGNYSGNNYLQVGSSPVATATTVLTANAGTTTVTFDFSAANLTLENDTTYAFYLSSTSPSFVWAGSSTDSYAGGEAAGAFMSNLGAGQPGFWLGNGDTAGDPARNVAGDRVFTVTAVPETSTTLLGGLGALALLRRRRK